MSTSANKHQIITFLLTIWYQPKLLYRLHN